MRSFPPSFDITIACSRRECRAPIARPIPCMAFPHTRNDRSRTFIPAFTPALPRAPQGSITTQAMLLHRGHMGDSSHSMVAAINQQLNNLLHSLTSEHLYPRCPMPNLKNSTNHPRNHTRVFHISLLVHLIINPHRHNSNDKSRISSSSRSPLDIRPKHHPQTYPTQKAQTSITATAAPYKHLSPLYSEVKATLLNLHITPRRPYHNQSNQQPPGKILPTHDRISPQIGSRRTNSKNRLSFRRSNSNSHRNNNKFSRPSTNRHHKPMRLLSSNFGSNSSRHHSSNSHQHGNQCHMQQAATGQKVFPLPHRLSCQPSRKLSTSRLSICKRKKKKKKSNRKGVGQRPLGWPNLERNSTRLE